MIRYGSEGQRARAGPGHRRASHQVSLSGWAVAAAATPSRALAPTRRKPTSVSPGRSRASVIICLHCLTFLPPLCGSEARPARCPVPSVPSQPLTRTSRLRGNQNGRAAKAAGGNTAVPRARAPARNLPQTPPRAGSGSQRSGQEGRAASSLAAQAGPPLAPSLSLFVPPFPGREQTAAAASRDVSFRFQNEPLTWE